MRKAATATHVRPIPVRHVIMDGHLLGKSLTHFAQQSVKAERFLVVLDTPFRCTSITKCFTVLHTCSIVEDPIKLLCETKARYLSPKELKKKY